MITKEDMDSIKHELDDRYVTQTDCNDKQEVTNRRFYEADKQVALISKDINLFKKLMWTITGSVIAELAALIANIIIKGV